MHLSEIQYVSPKDMSTDPRSVIPKKAGLTDAEELSWLMFSGHGDGYCYRLERVMFVLKATREEALYILRSAIRKLENSGFSLRGEAHERRRMRIAEDLQETA